MGTIALSGLPGTGLAVYFGAKAEPWRHYRTIPAGTADLTPTVTAGAASFELPDGLEALCFSFTGAVVHQVRHVMAGFTRTIPRLTALTPSSMVVASGDHELEIEGGGFSISGALHFGSAGTKEPLRVKTRPDGTKVGTTIVKTDLWTPGTQPVWISNAGMKSNVLTFTFTSI